MTIITIMPTNNPYIQKVLAHPKIITNTPDIYAQKWKWNDYFKNTHPTVLEIGTGMGNFFGKLCGENPNKNFIGMEIRYKRLFTTAEKARDWCLHRNDRKENFIVIKDFAQNIDQIFENEEVSETYIFFPDPWAKKDRQKKHRLLQENFLQKLYNITKSWGKVYFKTDHKGYFDSTKDIITSQWIWNIQNWTHDYENSDIFDMKNITEFEAHYRGSKLKICFLELEK